MDESITRHLEQGTNETADVLRRAKHAIRMPDLWWHCQSATNNEVCAWLAISRLHDNASKNWPAGSYLAKAIGAPSDDLKHIFRWNDAPERTHAEILAAFDRAIALAEAS